MLVLAAAALSPASAPTGVGILDPESYTSLWNTRLGGVASVVELGLLAVAALMLLRPTRTLFVRSTLDAPMVALAAAVGVLHFIALQRTGAGLLFQGLDLEQVGLMLGGYLLITRLAPGPGALRVLAALIAGSLLASFSYLVIRYGLLGSTEFGTVSGRIALLITEDTLLIAVPVVLGWGLLVDGLLSRRHQLAVAALLVTSVLVDLASLRRGALIFLGGAVGVRSLWAPRKWLLRGLAIACLGTAVALAGPARPLLADARYVVESALLQTEDAGTSQRESELKNFGRNIDGAADALLGKGLGAIWNVEVPTPVDPAAFGSGETDYVRVGWHVYGLDWLYKLGVAGALALLAAGIAGARRLREVLSEADDPLLGSLVRSLGLLAPILVLFLFTNPRIAFFAGVSLGLASAAADALRR